jgi:uncharacterized membrane protein
MNHTKVHIKRHIAKSISYRIIGSLTTFVISYIFTGNFWLSSSISFVEIVIKPLNYFLHERIWYKWIKFGIIRVKTEKQVSSSPLSNKKVLNYSSTR